MDIQELESVCAVDAYKNFSEAAFQINVSTAVISKHVSRVEQEFGVTLFERATKSRPVRLTPEGEALMGYFHTMRNAYRDACDKSKELSGNEDKTLTVGYRSGIGNYHETDILLRYMIMYPQVTIRRKNDSSSNLIKMLLNGDVDGIFLSLMDGHEDLDRSYALLNNENLQVEYMYRYVGAVLGVPDSHPLAKCETIKKEHFPLLWDDVFFFASDTPESIKPQQRKNLSGLLGFQKPMQTRYIDFSEPSIVCRMVELGEGILPLACNIPRRLHNVNFIPIEDSMKSVCCYFIFRKDNPSKSLRDLRRTIADFSSEMKDGILQQNGK